MQLLWLYISCAILFEFKLALSFRCTPTSRFDHTLYYYRIDNHVDFERREFLQKSASLTIGLVATSSQANAIEKSFSDVADYTSAPITTGNFDCLLDLPPITLGCVRLYLCRHGQTENNRLQKMGSVNYDSSINQNGHEQAQRLGLAISRLNKSQSGWAALPTLAVHSNLRRARETAEIAAATVNNNGSNIKVIGEPILSLGKMDYGSLDGEKLTYFLVQ